MNDEAGNRLYRAVKWLWLLLQALILPLAALHAVSAPLNWPLALPPPLLYFAGAVFLVLWLIAQSLLSMARFPLTLKGGALLVGGTVAQFASLVASGGSLAGAVYAVFFSTLAALAAVVAISAVIAIWRRIGPPQTRLAALLALLPTAGLAWFLATPLRPVFAGLTPWRQALEWLVLALNSGLIVFSLYRFSIFAPTPEKEAAYTAEWERWAAPTIIILILSATAAIALAGFARSRG
jgi:hypothetical protein